MNKKIKKIIIVFLIFLVTSFSYIQQQEKTQAAVTETAVVIAAATNPFTAAAICLGAFCCIGLGISLKNNIEAQAWGEKVLNNLKNFLSVEEYNSFIENAAAGKIEVSLELLSFMDSAASGVLNGEELDIPKTPVELDSQFPMRTIMELNTTSLNWEFLQNPDKDMSFYDTDAYTVFGFDTFILNGFGSDYTLENNLDIDNVFNRLTINGKGRETFREYIYRVFVTDSVARHYTSYDQTYLGTEFGTIGLPFGDIYINFDKPIPLIYKDTILVPLGTKTALPAYDGEENDSIFNGCRYKSFTNYEYITDSVGITGMKFEMRYGDCLDIKFPVPFYTTLRDLGINYSVYAPDYGIGLTGSIPVKNRFENIKTNDLYEMFEIAFPDVYFQNKESEVIQFNTTSNLARVGVLDLPKVSNKVFTDSQVGALDDIAIKPATEDKELAGIDDIDINNKALDNILGELDIVNEKTGAMLKNLEGIDSRVKTNTKKMEGIESNVKTNTDSITRTNSRVDSLEETAANTAAKTDTLAASMSGALDFLKGKIDSLFKFLKGLWEQLFDWLRKILNAILDLVDGFRKALEDVLTSLFAIDTEWFKTRLLAIKNMFLAKLPIITNFKIDFADKSEFDDLTANFAGVGEIVVFDGKQATKFAVIVKRFLSGLFYILTILFFIRKVYKVLED